MIALCVLLLFLVTPYRCNPISSGGADDSGEMIDMDVGDLWYVSALREVCFQVNVTLPPGTVSTHGSDLKIRRNDEEVHPLNKNRCMWNEEERFNMVGGHTSFTICSDGFGKDVNPRDDISILGKLKIRVECPRFLTQCRNVGEATDGSQIEENIFTLEIMNKTITKVVQHVGQLVDLCHTGATPQPCHTCGVSCSTLLFGGRYVLCNGWWHALSISTTSKVRFQNVREVCKQFLTH